MEIENKTIPEGINSSDDDPLKEFFLLTFGIIGTLVVLVVIISLAAELLAPFVPFRWEKKVAEQYQEALLQKSPGSKPDGSSEAQRQLTAYLQQLANRIAKAQSLPADMNVTVHYVDTDTINAFATLGGHIIVFRGLIEKLPDENALAWVMAHEISHIKNRDPIKSLGRGVIAGTVISITGVAIGDSMVENALGQSGLLTILKFSREQEEKADIEALYSLHALYGHVGSAGEFFLQARKLQEENSSGEFEFFATHPLTENRIGRIGEIARKQGWKSNGKPRSLPEEFFKWICTGGSVAVSKETPRQALPPAVGSRRCPNDH